LNVDILRGEISERIETVGVIEGGSGYGITDF